MSKCAFVTGGTGFVGRNLIEKLVRDGYKVNALVRSKGSVDFIRKLGATPIEGDLHSENALLSGCKGCNIVFHVAAKVGFEGTLADFMHDNVVGTKNVIRAAKLAGVKKFVHCSTEAVLAGGKLIANADETWPYPENPCGPYPTSKGAAEREVLAAADENFETVIIRPRFIWGKGDTVILPIFLKRIEDGSFKFFSGGNYLTSTTHVRNVVEGLIKGAERGKSGEIYFVTDGKPIYFRDFVTRLVATNGVDASKIGSAPLWFAKLIAKFGVIPETAIYLMAQECSINDAKARRELGYLSSVTIDEGMKELQEEAASKPKTQELTTSPKYNLFTTFIVGASAVALAWYVTK